jgi:C4-dicarboxylate-specific signal transduction histidine kinase
MLAFDRRLASVALHRGLDEGAGTASINAHALQQVITNLVLNALDATAGRSDPRISISTRREDGGEGGGGWCVLEVSDNGSGIAPEHLSRLFEPFFTTKPIGQGTGLGLTISARLIRDQGGKIAAASKVGEGTTFTIHLPAIDDPFRMSHAAPLEGASETPHRADPHRVQNA